MANGFFYNVSAVVNKSSFSDAIGEINKLREESKKLVVGIAGITKSVVNTAQIAGEVSTQELKMAKAIGVSSDALSSWKIAAGVAGASASGLISSLSSLENKMQRLKTGSVDSALAKNLAMLKIGYNDFAKMNSEERMKAVFSQADEMEDQKLAATLVSDILGSAGREYYDSLKISGKSLNQQLAEARQLNFVSEKNRKEAMLFASEVKAIKESGKSILQYFGARLGSAMLPIVRKIKGWIIENHATIQKALSGVADMAASVFDKILGVISKVAPFVSNLIDKFGGLDKLLIKVGIGFASAKLASFAGGIMQIVKSVGLLKAGVGGLLTGGLGLILEDLMYHFMPNGKSFIIDFVIPEIEKLGQALQEKLKGFGIDIDFKKLADGAREFGQNIAKFLSSIDWDKIAKGAVQAGKDLLQFGKDLTSDVWGLVSSAINNIKNLDKVITSLFNKDWKGARENLKAFWDEFKKGINSEGIADTAKSKYDEIIAKGGSKGQARIEAAVAAYQKIPLIGTAADFAAGHNPVFQKIAKGLYSLMGWDWDLDNKNIEKVPIYNKSGTLEGYEYKAVPTSKIKDGIVRPDGRTIGIEPNDWVFALKDVSNLASAFLPSNIVNNTANAPATYTINQSYTIQNGRAETVRAQAYKGTSDALKATIENASRIRQLMPGVR